MYVTDALYKIWRRALIIEKVIEIIIFIVTFDSVYPGIFIAAKYKKYKLKITSLHFTVV